MTRRQKAIGFFITLCVLLVAAAILLNIYWVVTEKQLVALLVGILLFALIIAGIIIGLLGKFVAPGDKDNIPIWLTIVCGIGGVLIGWFVYDAFGGDVTSGVDWVRWIVAILVAAVLVVIASTVTGRNTSKTSKVKSKFT